MPDILFTVLAIDPSTDVTGVAIVSFSPTGRAHLAQWRAFDARPACPKGTDLAARLQRIRWTRERIAQFVDAWPGTIDLVAYETDTERGHASSEALKMAAGVYLSLPSLSGLEVIGVTRQAACQATGTLSVYRESAGRTALEKRAKRARLKAAVIDWANRGHFNAGLRPDEDAIADALAIAQAVWVREVARRSQIKPLMGKGSRPRSPQATRAARPQRKAA